MTDLFAHMRPYEGAEVPEAIQALLSSLDWSEQLTPFLGEEAAIGLVEKLTHVSSVEEFQDQLSRVFIEMVLNNTSEKVTFSFPNGFDAQGALFISNHRDIVLDPSLINMGLISKGAETTQIGIGSNLLETPWVEYLVRLNKSFIVKRGGTPREQLKRSEEVANYVRHVILNETSSVWLAHREGRAKDGNDRTSAALIRMLTNGQGAAEWNTLRVHPVSLSYEWDPCDGMKVRELLLRERNQGEYEKSAGEDERSMKQGLFGWKGRIHVSFCEPIAWVEAPQGERPAAYMAELIDAEIHSSMQDWPSQHWAANEWKKWAQDSDMDWPENWTPSPVDESTQAQCENRITAIYDQLQSIGVTEHEVRMKWCEITMKPLLNQVISQQSMKRVTD